MNKKEHKNCLMLLQTTTTPANAEVLIEVALQSKLTPCIQHAEIQSHYFWHHSTSQNLLEVCHEKEILLSFKVFKQDFKTLRRLILQHHSYEIPEIVGIKLSQVSKAYKKWCQ
ncbi:divalent cation tolerance protein CutA, partial [Helicobacter ganmani]|uniref:divalent cation tolerance protein CutA n=2 Tax=Helicobacteraceae TaxID=72293 RepID=UPI003A8B898A